MSLESQIPSESGPQCCGTENTPDPGLSKSDLGRSYRITGLCCAEEVATLTKVVAPEIGGPEHLAFDVINARMTILNGSRSISDEKLYDLVQTTGMSAKPWDLATRDLDHSAQIRRQTRFTAMSGFFWLAGLVYHLFETGLIGIISIFSGHPGNSMPVPEISSFMIAIVFGVWLVAPKAWSALKRFSPDMNLLMIVAVAGAIILGEYFEAATVSLFFALSLTLESWSVGRARNAVSTLLNLAPDRVRLVAPDRTEKEVPASSVKIGEIFIIRGGDRIPLDGVVKEGTGAVDQAPITGESAPVLKEAGDEVYAGTINGEGTLTIEATKPASDTVLAKITRMVGEAHSKRANVEQWVTKFARIYTPTVMVIAAFIASIPPMIGLGEWNSWIYNALVLLVIACPCALVISTPVSIVAALAASARQGVLIKGGAYVEIAGKLEALAMDKTGTITRGEPEIASLHPIGISEPELVRIAASLELHSSHPLARAIVAKSDTKVAASDTRTVPGRGVTGVFEGKPVWLGSSRFVTEKGAHIPERLHQKIQNSGNTLVAVGSQDNLYGIIEITDSIRLDAKEVISSLHDQGVQQIVMLTGDNQNTAASVAKAVGIDEVQAELLPQDKVSAIEELAAGYDVVAMIGDGVNDAPAMARASFAIAMGAAGSDTAIETADIALMSDDIGKLPWLIDHSRRTLTIIRQNIFFALVTKALFVGLTLMGLATMWGAIIADVGVSLAVIANALRLLKAKDSSVHTQTGNSLQPQLAID